jgi:phage-related holin
MLEAILSILKIMGWLGVILGILVVVNICTKTINNVWSSKELFSWKKMLKGIGKALVFYVSAVFICVAFTILPYVNEMITDTFGMILISNEMLETLSSVGVLGTVISTIVVQGKSAITGVLALSKVSTNSEEITWTVEEE